MLSQHWLAFGYNCIRFYLVGDEIITLHVVKFNYIVYVEFHLTTLCLFSNSKDSFTTMVYNDETHTFDYVIEILQDAVHCSSKRASDFATVIDREVSFVRVLEIVNI